MEARSKSIEDWFGMIRAGQITLPRFQRFEAWRPNQVEGVLENILRYPSLPIGALLVLEVGDRELFNSRPITGAPEPAGRPQLNLLDGQQRMTALWRSLNDDYEDFTVFVMLNGDAHPEVDITRRYIHAKSGKRMPRWADDPKETYARGLVPISVLCPGANGEQRFADWVDQADVGMQQQMQIMKLRQRLASYTIPFLSLPVSTEQETALDVFINMNTSASPLKDFDIVVAQIEGSVGQSLHDMIEELHAEVPAAKEYGRIEELVLSVGALLNGKPPLKKTFLDPDFGTELPDVWGRLVHGVRQGVSFLRDEAIFNEKLLPTEVIVYLSAALWADVPEHGADAEGRARNLIRKAIWRSSYTDRYLKTAATRAYADYRTLSRLIASPTSEDVPDLFDEDQNPLPQPDELIRGGWPSRKERLGRAILVTSLYSGGYDFADGAKATPHNIRAREFHHVFPRSLIEGRFPDYEVNSALNCALISWKTNRKIAAKSPKAYIDERARDANATEEQVKRRLESHRVPYEKLTGGDFGEFVRGRAELIYADMLKLCNGSVP